MATSVTADDAASDQIIQDLVFARMVSRGLANVRAGRTIGDAEMRRMIESWRDAESTSPATRRTGGKLRTP